MSTIEDKKYKIQVVRCKCGKIFAACWEPMCYEDASWQRQVRKDIAKRGCTIELLDPGEWHFEECTCPKPENKKKQPQLF